MDLFHPSISSFHLIFISTSHYTITYLLVKAPFKSDEERFNALYMRKINNNGYIDFFKHPQCKELRNSLTDVDSSHLQKETKSTRRRTTYLLKLSTSEKSAVPIS